MSTAEPWFNEIREAFRQLDGMSAHGLTAGLGESLPILREQWEALAGSLAHDMLASREMAERYLRNGAQTCASSHLPSFPGIGARRWATSA